MKPIEYDSDGNPILSDVERKKNSDNSDDSSNESSSSGEEDVAVFTVGEQEKEVAPVATTSNPNRDQKKNLKLSDLSKTLANTNLDEEETGMSRKERYDSITDEGSPIRDALEAKRKKEAYMKLHLAGKTDQAKSDMARLAEIRKQREEAAKRREAELQAKNDSKSQSLAAGKSIISKTLGTSGANPMEKPKKR